MNNVATETMQKLDFMQRNNITVKEYHENYLINCKVRNLAEKTLKLYQEHFDMFLLYLKKENISDILLSSVNSKIIDGFILYLRERGIRDTTVNSYMRDIRAFFYFCMEDEQLPRFKIKLPKADKRIKETYTDAELAILLKKPDIKKVDFTEYKMWVFSNYLLATGNRISSILELKIKDLDFDNCLIQVDKTKNRKSQIIPMSKALSGILREYLLYRKGEEDEYVFCNCYGKKAELRTYQNMLYKYNRNRGVQKTSAHLYRHTFAKKWILNGGDIFRLQKILGHSDLTVVREYVNMFSKDLSIDFELFNPLDNFETHSCGSKIKLRAM